MDREKFIEDAFVAYSPTPNSGVIDRAIREAETDTGYKVANISEDSLERQWLVKRTERHTLWLLLNAAAEEHNYGPVGSRDQIFQHYKQMFEKLDAEWPEIKRSILMKSGGSFRVIPPGFDKGAFGNPG